MAGLLASADCWSRGAKVPPDWSKLTEVGQLTSPDWSKLTGVDQQAPSDWSGRK